MGKPSAKKTAKQKKKKSEQRKKELSYREKKRYEFEIDIHGKCPAEFISFVKTKVDELLSNTSIARKLSNSINEYVDDLEHPIIKLNIDVFNSIPDVLRKRHMDSFRCSYRILFKSLDSKCLSINFRQLRQMNCDGSYCYFSPRMPKVEIDGTKYIVAYSKHVLQRIAERAVLESTQEYLGYDSMCELLYNCNYFETYKRGVVIWCPCSKRFASEYIGQYILGTNQISSFAHYKLGYCPIVKCGNIAVIKTFLHPGYKTTPEGNWIRKKRISDIKIEGNLEYNELLRIFHQEAGIEQVKDIFVKVIKDGFR